MIILPAVDLKDGKAVRLFQGDMDTAKIYADQPETMAKKWEDLGGHILHVVDLDGAFSGKTENRDAIGRIVQAVTMPVEVGGGMRSIEAMKRVLDLGVSRVILGTAAVENPALVSEALAAFGPEKIVVGIDAKDGEVKVAGWAGGSSIDYITLGKAMKERGVLRVVYTDIDKDGAMKGPNLENTARLARETGLAVIASGGVATPQDVEHVKALESDGVEGMIIGKALYEGTIDLAQVI